MKHGDHILEPVGKHNQNIHEYLVSPQKGMVCKTLYLIHSANYSIGYMCDIQLIQIVYQLKSKQKGDIHNKNLILYCCPPANMSFNYFKKSYALWKHYLYMENCIVSALMCIVLARYLWNLYHRFISAMSWKSWKITVLSSDVYAPFMGIMFSGLCVCSFVWSSIRSLIRSCFSLTFLVEVVFDQVEIRSIWNLVHMFPMIWSF